MKNKVKWVVLAVVLVVVIAGATILYQTLSKNYSGNNLMQNTQTQDQTSEEEEIKYVAPDFTVLDGNGNEVQLSDYR